jgi:hypothetical protein
VAIGRAGATYQGDVDGDAFTVRTVVCNVKWHKVNAPPRSAAVVQRPCYLFVYRRQVSENGEATSRRAILEHLDAFNQHDTRRLIAGLSSTVVWRTGSDRFEGHSQLGALFGDALWDLAPSLLLRSLLIDGKTAAAELREDLTVDGVAQAFAIAVFFEIEAGLIERATVYREGSADIA